MCYQTCLGAVPIGMFLLATAYCCYTISELLHNALLPAAGDSKSLPMISGLGLAFGNTAGVIMLIGLIAASYLSPWVQAQPGQIGPLSGPIVAVWLAIFIIPFFLFMPDHYGRPGLLAARRGRDVYAAKLQALGTPCQV